MQSAVVWSKRTGEEQARSEEHTYVFDWSADGKTLLVQRWHEEIHRSEIWTMPVDLSSADPPTKIAANPDFYLFQPRLSPDGRWIAFEAVRDRPEGRTSSIFVVPRKGGSWIPVTDGKQWDDKPRWSADGKTIYFISSRGGFNNAWGRQFDPVRGEAKGDSFQVTSFSSPALMPSLEVTAVDLAIAANRLAINVSSISGGVWVLDNVDR